MMTYGSGAEGVAMHIVKQANDIRDRLRPGAIGSCYVIVLVGRVRSHWELPCSAMIPDRRCRCRCCVP